MLRAAVGDHKPTRFQASRSASRIRPSVRGITATQTRAAAGAPDARRPTGHASVRRRARRAPAVTRMETTRWACESQRAPVMDQPRSVVFEGLAPKMYRISALPRSGAQPSVSDYTYVEAPSVEEDLRLMRPPRPVDDLQQAPERRALARALHCTLPFGFWRARTSPPASWFPRWPPRSTSSFTWVWAMTACAGSRRSSVSPGGSRTTSSRSSRCLYASVTAPRGRGECHRRR
jgi:hypothetical protein